MKKEEWAQIAEERQEIFKLDWFKRLLRGELSLGDTFWIGNFGVALVFVPAAFVVTFVLNLIGFNNFLQTKCLGLMLLALAIYYAFLTRAVFLTAQKTPQVGAWRWVGFLYTVLNCINLVVFATIFLFEASYL